MTFPKRILMVLSLSMLASFFVTACDNSFEPFNEDEGFYSIFGGLDLHADTNFIRVKDLNIPLNDDTSRQVDFTVTLNNLTNGSSETLKDSVIIFDSVLTHNFYTTRQIREASEYEIVVDGSDGKSVSMTRTTPYDSDILIDTGDIADGCTARVTIEIEPVMNISTLFPTITFVAESKIKPGEEEPEVYQYIPEDIRFTNVNGEGSGTTLFDFTPREALSANDRTCSHLLDDEFGLSLLHFGSGYQEIKSDSIRIPGGEGRFIAYYDTTKKFLIPALTPYVKE